MIAGRPLNPVLARELRIRLRGRQGWVLLTIYLVLLAAIAFMVYQGESGGLGGDQFSAPSPTRFASVGRAVFEWLVLFMLLLVLFLVPGFTSGAIAGERERQTLVPLQVTLLRPWQIVVGKLAASFAYLALLVVAAAPFLAVAYLIGGVTMGAVLRSVGVVLFVGLCLSAITVCCSALFKRVQIATVIAYAVVLVLLVGTLLVWASAGIVDGARGDDSANPPAELLALNPLFLAADILADEDVQFSSGVSSPFEPMVDVLLRDRYGADVQSGEVFIDGPFPGPRPGFFPGGGFAVDVAGGFAGGTQEQPIIGFDEFGNPIFAEEDDGFPFWALSAIGLYVLAAGAGLLAVRRLRTPAASER